jgi:hypothetical protein
MPDNHEPHPARRPRGSLSARQWQEIRQAARLARSEGVEASRFGFTFRPAPGSQTSRRPGETEARGTVEPRPSMRQPSTRNVRRAMDFQARQKWLPLVRRLLRVQRGKLCAGVWTSFMRLRKLRGLLWREWTRPQFGGSTVDPVLGELSHRDQFILAKARYVREKMDESLAEMLTEQERSCSRCPLRNPNAKRPPEELASPRLGRSTSFRSSSPRLAHGKARSHADWRSRHACLGGENP